MAVMSMAGKNESGEDWREVRYLYRYNQQELEEWADSIQKLAKESKRCLSSF